MAAADPQYPFTAFNFGIEIKLPKTAALYSGSFSECDGLEMTMEVKTIREGGNNGAQIRFTGPLTYGQLVLKRGMTKDTDMWDWFRDSFNDPSLRATAEVIMFGSAAGKQDKQNETRRFVFKGCVPVKVKAPALNAKEGLIAIEELQIAYESMELKTTSGKAG
jgi:phage tail-like protein